MLHHILFRSRTRGAAPAAALALACLFAVAACSGGAKEAGKDDEKAEEAVPVEVAGVTRQAVAASYTGTAPLEAPTEAQVVAKTSGVALEVLVEEGDHVRAGQVLARLDADRARLQADQTAAQMRKLENQFARAERLAAEQLIAASDHDQIRFDLENARATNRLANLELSYAEVKAPIDGVVASVSPKPGNFVQINTPIVRIVDTSRLEAVLNVPERELATLQTGLPVTMQVDALPGQTFEGVIDRMSPVVDAGSGTFRVIMAFEGGGVLQPGMFGRISIDYDQRADALVVPRVALLEGQGEPAVFAVREGKVARTPIELGYLDGQWAEVRGGLELGDQVVVAGKSALREGTAVSVIGAPAPAALADGAGAEQAASPTAQSQ
ncbi:efflux RND transporter periplasmic adaptor subunit [Novilysobacter spongiicola]|uniref:Membrane fusion protein, multidrug efflux system n=1 Tax=Lysobacter spongiicola DSM 21749 TaxID=1122188 RepID=A0A1T4LVH7_9GAMM|nr:efflux RND transporter periplasmic adaptor subunit [Lysobacter spongiicola]SJZ58464.1 membrane fusion protein, multidrug efflux system [Lysobacter spongiicola DSM 21749]